VNGERNIQDSSNDRLRPLIVAAARSRFERFGYSKTSMHEIAGDCRMSAANLYRYFDGKLAIGAAVAAEEQRGLLADCDHAAEAAAHEPIIRLVTLFQAIIATTRRQMTAAPLLFELRLAVWREKPELRNQFLREIEVRIVAALAEDPVGGAGVDPGLEVAGRLVLLASAPFVLPWMMQNVPFGDPQTQVEPLVRCLVLGIAASREARSAAVAGD
jgi:AcrR family transcriptional regulator